MRAIACAFGIVLSAVFAGGAQAQPDQLEAFAASPSLWDVELSPEGRWVATGCGLQGQRNVCIYDLQGQARPRLFAAPETTSIYRFYWASERHLIIDVGFQFFYSQSMTAFVGRGIILDVETGAETFVMSNLSNGIGNTNSIVSIDLENPDSVIAEIRMDNQPDRQRLGTRLRNRQEVVTVLYRVDLDNGRGSLMARDSNRPVWHHVMTPQGEIVARVFYSERQDVYSIENPQGETLFETQPGGRLPGVGGVIDDGTAVVMRFQEGPMRGPARLDLTTGELTRIVHPASDHGDFGPIVDDWTGSLVGFSGYRADLPSQYFVDEELATLTESLRNVLARGIESTTVRLLSWTRDRSMFAVQARRTGMPAEYYLFERDGNALSPLGVEADALAGRVLGRVEAMTYAASDGLEIPAFLTLPPDRQRGDGPFPLVVMPHGGPDARDDARYDWWAQYYASLGYVVLQPNFRGSAGYGQAFRQAGYGEFGGRMIRDVIDGAAHLVAEGVAAPGGYCAAGASYGGYAALMIGLLDPQNVRCVVAVHSVTDPVDMMGASGRYGRRYWEQYIGDLYMGDERRHEISPRRRAGELQAPILLMHGVEDTTVDVGQSRALARAMRDGDLLTFIEMPGADHYFVTTESRRQLLEESGDFLLRHLPVD